LCAGPKGEGGLDDATGAGGAGGASMKQSSGVVDLGGHLYALFISPMLSLWKHAHCCVFRFARHDVLLAQMYASFSLVALIII